MRAAVLRYDRLPIGVDADIPDIEVFIQDDMVLIHDLMALRVNAQLVRWNDPTIQWDDYDLALIRCTWDYIDDLPQFLEVLEQIEASRCQLFNSLPAVRWNSQKTYLLDLIERGVPTIPTYRVGNHRELEADEWVLKPIVGAGGTGLIQTSSQNLNEALEGLRASGLDGDYLIQPMVDSIRSEGEWSFVFIDGEFSNALIKKPARGDYRIHDIYGGTTENATPAALDLRQAERIAALLPYDFLYSRLDLVRIGSDLHVMEVELIEPMLYFELCRDSSKRLAQAVYEQIAHGVRHV